MGEVTENDKKYMELMQKRELTQLGEALLLAPVGAQVGLTYHFASKEMSEINGDGDEAVLMIGGSFGAVQMKPILVKSYYSDKKRAEQRAKIEETFNEFKSAVLAQFDKF